MKIIACAVCALLLALASLPTQAVPTQWVTNSISSSNVFDAGPFPPEFGERPRLGAATFGFIEGTIVLPTIDDWTLDFVVSFDGNAAADLTDYVRVILDGAHIGDFTNDALYPVNYHFTAASVDYRFEFNSSNTDIGLHQIVNAGTVTSVQVSAPVTLGLVGFTLFALAVVRRRAVH